VKTLPRRTRRRGAPKAPLAGALGCSLLLLAAGPAPAQGLLSEPLVFGNGRLTIGGDVSITFSCADSNQPNEGACADDAGFFNYTDYEHSALRMLRADVTAAVRATDHISVLAEVRLNCNSSPPCGGEKARALEPYGFYLRLRPWTARAFDVQIGRIPPTFGGFPRRAYPADNILIGYPLAYQYLTSLRPDALPANTDELLRMRGRGWLSTFSVGDADARAGMPLVSAFRWDTGLQAHGVVGFFDAAVAVTTGTVGHPLVRDNNGGKQIAARVSAHPTAGLVLGGSAAHGPFATRQAAEAAGGGGAAPWTQAAWGLDAEYSHGYYLVRMETIVSRWQFPTTAGLGADTPLRAYATSIEGRYRFHPRMYAAGRFDWLDFSEVMSSTARRDEWDAPVRRLETGIGVWLQRNLLLKAAFQANRRDTARVSRVNTAAAQAIFWF
jgi:hypothetical protein